MNPLKLFLKGLALKEDAMTNIGAWLIVACAGAAGWCIYLYVTLMP